MMTQCYSGIDIVLKIGTSFSYEKESFPCLEIAIFIKNGYISSALITAPPPRLNVLIY